MKIDGVAPVIEGFSFSQNIVAKKPLSFVDGKLVKL